MAKNLYHSKAPIHSARHTAARISPGTARMTGGEGLKAVGEAMFSIGLQMHQVNVARQVANAVSQYKMNEAQFMSDMMNSDPSTTDYDQKWGEFIAGQGELSTGVSRDASNIIQTKLKTMQSSDYKTLKRMEITNTRSLVMNELPGIMDSLLRTQVKAEMDGDVKRATQTRTDMVQYLQGVAPTLRPGEGAKMIRMYDSGLAKARREEEAQRFAAQVLTDPIAAEKMIDDGKLKHQTPEQLLSLRSMARGQQGKKIQLGKLQENMMLDEQSKVLLDQYLGDDAIAPMADMHPDLREAVTLLNEKSADQVEGVIDGETHPIYYKYKSQLQSFTAANPILNESDILRAATVLSKEQVAELRTLNEENKRLLPRRNEVKSTITQVNARFKSVEQAIYTMIKNPDNADILRRELGDARASLIKEVRKDYMGNTPHLEIIKKMQDVFEGTKKGILEGAGFLGWRKAKFGIHNFVEDLERGVGKTAEAIEAHRTQAIINLLMSGKHSREIEAAIEAGWFSE